MAHITGELIIHRPIAEVFDFVADERNEPRYNARRTSAEKVSPGPLGAGTRFRSTVIARGKPVQLLIEITDYERPRRLGSTTHTPHLDIRGTLTLEPISEGTWLEWSWEVTPHGALRLCGPLIALRGQRHEEALWSSLKQCLETQPPPSSQTAQAAPA